MKAGWWTMTPDPAEPPGCPPGGLWADAGRSWRNLNTGRLLFSGFERWEAAVLARLHEGGWGDVRRTHFNILRHLDAEGTRMSDLAERANVTKAAVTALVRSCEALGLVTSSAGAADRRARLVAYTPKGLELMEFFRATMLALEDEVRDRLGPAAYAELRAALLALSGLTEVVPFTAPARRRAARF